MRSRVPLPVLVLAVLAALLIGSVGSATASGLTTKSVKKIAAKVVKKQAPKLSVASAANATNATNLAGKPASAYLDESRVFVTSVVTPTSSVIIPLPLAAGTYYMSYHAYMPAGSGYSGCYFRRTVSGTANAYFGDDVGTSNSPAYSGSAVVPLAAGETLELYCFSATSFTTLAGAAPDPIQVVATPLDGVTTTAVAPTRPSGTDGRP